MYKDNFKDKLNAFDADLPKNNAISDADENNTIKKLAKLSKLEYDRERITQAKIMGIRPATLDDLVKAENSALTQDDDPFSKVEPWHEAIDPSQLLNDITSVIQRFVVLDEPQAKTAALWVAATWFINDIHCAPILLINAPERACGKTQLLTVLAKLAQKSIQASGITPSVLFRLIEKYLPTLFVDEIETVLKENEDLRGLINAGHTRDSAFVWRSVSKGDDFEPKRFSVWGMKAIAGINAIKLAETVTSRSIIIELRRKKTEETVERLRNAEAELFEEIKAKLARFQIDYAIKVRKINPELPNWLSDREQDNFEPLLQIATIAGSKWLTDVYECAKILTTDTQENISIGNELLADIREILEAKSWIKISLAELINELCNDDEKAWATYNRGDSIRTRQLSKKLADYGISSKTIRANDNKPAKGYETCQFKDAFERYLNLPKNIDDSSNISLKPTPSLSLNVTNDVTNPSSSSNSNHSVTPPVAKNTNGINSLVESVTNGSDSLTEAKVTNNTTHFVSF